MASTLKAKLAAAQQQHTSSPPPWCPRPKSVLKLHIGEELVRTVDIEQLVDNSGNLSYKRLVNLAVESTVSAVSGNAKDLPKGWEITTLYANEYGDRVVFSGDEQFTSAFKKAERRRPVDISAFYLAAISPKTTRASAGTVFRCWVDINLPTPKLKVPRGGPNGHIPIGMRGGGHATKKAPHKTTRAWMRPPPSDHTMRNYHQLQLLLESFVCILARALLIVHQQYNPLQIESGPHKTRRTVGRGTGIRLSAHAANIKSVTDMQLEETSETSEKKDSKPSATPSNPASAKADGVARTCSGGKKNVGQNATSRPEVLLDRLMNELNRKINARKTSDNAKAISTEENKRPKGQNPKFKHWRFGCDGCMKYPIVGFRYHATNIPNYDLCEECVSKVAGCDKTLMEGDDRYQSTVVRSVRREKNVRHFHLPSDSLLQQARMSTQRKKEQGSTATLKRTVFSPLAKAAKISAETCSSKVEAEEPKYSEGVSEKESEIEQVTTDVPVEAKKTDEEKMSDETTKDEITKEETTKDEKDVAADKKEEETVPEEKTVTPEDIENKSDKTVNGERSHADNKKVELDPTISQVMNSFENAVLTVGGLVHEVVEGGIKVSRDAQPSASYAARESKKQAAIFAAAVVGAAKRAAEVAAESKKRAEKYAENVKRAAAEAESKRYAATVATSNTAKPVEKEEKISDNEVVTVSEKKQDLVEEKKEEVTDHVVNSAQMEEECEEDSPSIECAAINEESEAKEVAEEDDAGANEAEECEANEAEEGVTQTSVNDEEPMVPSIILDDEDEASSSISFSTPCTKSDGSVQSEIASATSDDVVVDETSEKAESVSIVSSEDCSLVSAPTSVGDEWDVVDSHNGKDEDSLARATVLIGSSLFEADVNRTDDDDAVVVAPSDEEKSVSSASVASSMSFVSQVSSEGSSISFVSTGSVMTFDSSVASMTDDFDVVEATLDL